MDRRWLENPKEAALATEHDKTADGKLVSFSEPPDDSSWQISREALCNQSERERGQKKERETERKKESKKERKRETEREIHRQRFTSCFAKRTGQQNQNQ